MGDVDGDGDVDIVCGNEGSRYGPQNRLYLNDGAGTYADATAARLPTDTDDTVALALEDLDGDGDLDLILGNGSSGDQQNRAYLNDGAGTFVDVTSQRMPLHSDSHSCCGRGRRGWRRRPRHPLREWPVLRRQQNRLYLNDGSGTFADVTGKHMPADSDRSYAAKLSDVDGDSDLDIVVGNGAFTGQQNRIYLNDGTGSYADATAGALPIGPDSTEALAVEDVDGDGDRDIVFGNYLQNRLLLNDASGTFADATARRLPIDSDWSTALALGDVDEDGDLDIVFGNVGSNRLYLNDGYGTLIDVTATRMPIESNRTHAVVFGDIDGDGDLDIVFGNVGSNRLYLNDGSGTFTDSTASGMPADTPTSSTLTLAMADVDGDGDLDLVFGNSGAAEPALSQRRPRQVRRCHRDTHADGRGLHVCHRRRRRRRRRRLRPRLRERFTESALSQ